MKKKKPADNTIVLNRKARHDYTIETRFEAGIILEGWEVKSIRAGKVQLVDSYVILKDGEAWLLGANIVPLLSASTHINPDQTRTRKLLLHNKELSKLQGALERKGYTLIALSLYWKQNLVKAEIALCKGKKDYDKRAALKDKQWQREKGRLLKNKVQGG